VLDDQQNVPGPVEYGGRRMLANYPVFVGVEVEDPGDKDFSVLAGVKALVFPYASSVELTGPLQADAQGNPIIPNQQAIYAIGVDTEFEVVRNSLLSLIPYVDFNRIAGAGNGLHAGVLSDVRLPVPLLEMNVQAKLEYRMMQPGYIPEYFDQTYDIGRVQYAVQQGASTTYVAKYDAALAANLLLEGVVT